MTGKKYTHTIESDKIRQNDRMKRRTTYEQINLKANNF